ncbi:hypothetical protein H7J87_11685 [Mycolicibacterium wolinskyi]|uniref:hypothetical protein n=1 Tax=Mycolicibacterium TaxID=1866885 RepID=UPI0013FD39F3|nr:MULTISPECIES: hypothetical protein [Mycolicibacterium]MCV7285991.1 hypothetical protein [Mycolicibacterium wolinskyi]MCV7296187.1 hypothetical protein [Mycolicibacterium goodii]
MKVLNKVESTNLLGLALVGVRLDQGDYAIAADIQRGLDEMGYGIHRKPEAT